MPRGLGRPSPHPRLGTSIELRRRHAPGLVDLAVVGKTLAGERIAAEEAPTDPNQPSCKLSQHAPVGMKIWWMRECSTSQALVSALR
jgi:hypothetical protein